MGDSFVRVPADSVGKRIDATSLDVGANTVYRQRVVIGDDGGTANFAAVVNNQLQVGGTIDKISATVAVAGTVALAAGTVINNISATVNVAGTFTISTIDKISATVTVVGVVSLAAGSVLDSISATVGVKGQVSLGPGTSNIGFINNISATVAVTGTVALVAGTANIGFINGISATVTVTGVVTLGTGTNNIGTINNISATVNVAGTFTISTIDKISATVTVVGVVSLATGSILDSISATVGVKGQVSLGPGTSNIGFINNISATVIIAGEISAGASLSTINKPVLIGGNDSAGGAGGIARTLLLDTSGRVILGAGTNLIGAVSNAAGTALMGAVSLAAGTAKIGFIGKISATVGITGTVALAAGTANFGTLNDISRTVQVAVGTPFIIQGISTTVTIAMSNQTLQGISTTVQAVVAGRVAVSVSVTVGDQPLLTGGIAKISASATATAIFGWYDYHGRNVVVQNHPPLLPTASHGPKCVTASTSAGVALIAAPGAGLCVYVTMLACTNGSSTLTRADVFEASKTASCVAQMYMAASGGGFVTKYDPPIKVTSNSGVTCRVKPNVSQAIFNVHFYVGAK